MHTLSLRVMDLSPGPSEIHDLFAAEVGRSALLCVEGTFREWARASQAMEQGLRNASSITVGICLDADPAISGGLPACLLACDLRVLVAEAPGAREVWNRVFTTVDAARTWVAGLDRSFTGRGPAAVTCARTLRLTSELGEGDALWVEALAYSLLQAGPDHQRWLSQHRTS